MSFFFPLIVFKVVLKFSAQVRRDRRKTCAHLAHDAILDLFGYLGLACVIHSIW